MSCTNACTVPTAAHAIEMIRRLRRAGFNRREISIFFPDRPHSVGLMGEIAAMERSNPALPTAAGVLGWLVGVAAVRVAECGAGLAAGPLMSTLAFPMGGADGFGLEGALYRLGVSAPLTERLLDGVRCGEHLVMVHAEDPQRLERAEQVFAEQAVATEQL